jgi:Na+-driven multidrug efflux pump
MQALFLPVVALSFAVSPVVGQNFGGRHADRVRQTIYAAIGVASAVMFFLALLAHYTPGLLIRGFSADPRVISFGSEYLRIVALNFVAAGIAFSTSSAFQGLGNTIPPLFSSMIRVLLFAVPALILSHRAGFEIREVWYLSVGTQIFQACLSLFLLWRELRKKLVFSEASDFTPGIATS